MEPEGCADGLEGGPGTKGSSEGEEDGGMRESLACSADVVERRPKGWVTPEGQEVSFVNTNGNNTFLKDVVLEKLFEPL